MTRALDAKLGTVLAIRKFRSLGRPYGPCGLECQGSHHPNSCLKSVDDKLRLEARNSRGESDVCHDTSGARLCGKSWSFRSAREVCLQASEGHLAEPLGLFGGSIVEISDIHPETLLQLELDHV